MITVDERQCIKEVICTHIDNHGLCAIPDHGLVWNSCGEGYDYINAATIFDGSKYPSKFHYLKIGGIYITATNNIIIYQYISNQFIEFKTLDIDDPQSFDKIIETLLMLQNFARIELEHKRNEQDRSQKIS